MSFDPTRFVTFYGQDVVADYDNKVRLAVSGRPDEPTWIRLKWRKTKRN